MVLIRIVRVQKRNEPPYFTVYSYVNGKWIVFASLLKRAVIPVKLKFLSNENITPTT